MQSAVLRTAVHMSGALIAIGGASPVDSVPGKPTNLLAVGSAGQVTLTWDAPGFAGTTPITDYNVYYRVLGGSIWTAFDNGTSTALSAVIPGVDGTFYEYYVEAINSIGPSLPSSVTSGRAGVPATRPAQVTNVQITPGDGELVITWDAPADGGSPITDYLVEYRQVGSGSWLELVDAVSFATSRTIGSLSVGTEYESQIYAINDEGTGDPSTVVSELTNDVPAQPVAPTLTSGNAQLLADGAAPADGGSAITDFEWQYSTDDVNFTTFSDGVSTDTAATITSLTNGTLYYIRRRAVNANGPGAWSPSNSETPADVSFLVDHDFSSDPGYIFGGGANITGGTLNLPAANDNGRFLFPSTAGNDYRIRFDVSGLNGGQLVIYMGTWSSGTAGSVHTVGADGSVDVTLTMHNNYAGFRVLKTATTGGTIDNLTVEEV